MFRHLLIMAVWMICLMNLGYSQQVTIHMPNEKGNMFLQVSSPFHGYMGRGDIWRKEYCISSSNPLRLDMRESGAGLYRILVGDARFSLMLTAEDSLDLTLLLADGNLQYSFKGTNVSGHELWMSYTFPISTFMRKHEEMLDGKHSDGLQVLSEITLSTIKEVANKFDSLKNKKLVSDEYAKLSTSWLSSFLGWDFISFNTEVKNRKWVNVRPYAKKILDQTVGLDTLCYPLYSKFISRFYEDDYYADTSKGKVEKKELPHTFQQVLFVPKANGLQEYIFAETLMFYASGGYDEVEWDRAFKYYKKLYPYTALSIRLDSLLYPYMDKVKVDKTILDKEYKTLNELFSEFKGQTLFIDLWATWCMPCRSEMRMEILKPLDVELEKRNIRKLYLSVDDNERDSLWKRSIDVLKLSGYHHRVGKKLYKDIQRQVYKIEQFSVPRYLLWEKDGQLLSIDLPRPSTGKKLLDEIDRLLNY